MLLTFFCKDGARPAPCAPHAGVAPPLLCALRNVRKTRYCCAIARAFVTWRKRKIKSLLRNCLFRVPYTSRRSRYGAFLLWFGLHCVSAGVLVSVCAGGLATPCKACALAQACDFVKGKCTLRALDKTPIPRIFASRGAS